MKEHRLRKVLLFAAFLAITAFSVMSTAVAHASPPRWFVEESPGVHEHELVGTLNLSVFQFGGNINLYLEQLGGGGEESIELADDCSESSFEGVSLIGEGASKPGRVEIETLRIGGCSEALSEPCTVASSSESATVHNISGELVRALGSRIDVLFEPVKFSLDVKCGSSSGTEKFEIQLLPNVDAFAYSPLTEQLFSSIGNEYLNAEEEVVDAQSGASGPACANMTEVSTSVLYEPNGGSEIKEIKAE
jgi:hypothetical protein